MNEGNKNRFVANGKQHVPELNYLQSIILITPQCACTYWAEPSICVCRFKYLYLRFCSAQAHSYCCSFDNKEEVSECAHICVSVSDIKCLCWSIRFCFFFCFGIVETEVHRFTWATSSPLTCDVCVRACVQVPCAFVPRNKEKQNDDDDNNNNYYFKPTLPFFNFFFCGCCCCSRNIMSFWVGRNVFFYFMNEAQSHRALNTFRMATLIYKINIMRCARLPTCRLEIKL